MSPPRASPSFPLHLRSTYTLLDPHSLNTNKLFQTTTFQFKLLFHPPSTNFKTKHNQTKPPRCNLTSSLCLPPWPPLLLLNRMLFVIFGEIPDADMRPRTVYVTVPCSTSHVASSGVASPTLVASTGVKTSPTPTGSPISYATGAASVNAISGSALGMIIAGGVALVSSVKLTCWNSC